MRVTGGGRESDDLAKVKQIVVDDSRHVVWKLVIISQHKLMQDEVCDCCVARQKAHPQVGLRSPRGVLCVCVRRTSVPACVRACAFCRRVRVNARAFARMRIFRTAVSPLSHFLECSRCARPFTLEYPVQRKTKRSQCVLSYGAFVYGLLHV